MKKRIGIVKKSLKSQKGRDRDSRIEESEQVVKMFATLEIGDGVG